MTLSQIIRPPQAASVLALALVLGSAPALAQEAGEAAADQTPEAGVVAGEGEDASMALDELSAETVIATIGDFELTLGQLIAVRQSLPQQYQQLPPEVLTEGLLSQLVNQTVLAVRADAQGLDERVDVRLNLLNQRQSALADAYLRARVEQRVDAAAIEAAYRERYAEAAPTEQVKASHILVEDKATAEDIRAKLADGAAFADLAKEYGTDGTAEKGGELGWFEQGDMVPEFSEAAFALEVGEVSEPVETPFGWHLIRVADRRDKPVPKLEEVRQEIAQSLAEQAQESVVEQARSEAEVSFPDRKLPAEAILQDALIAPEEAE